jgi:hypothetical protein
MKRIPSAESARAAGVAHSLRQFIGIEQLECIFDGLKGEEWQFFVEKLDELRGIIDKTHTTGQQEQSGERAIVHLHYFKGAGDWFITKKDIDTDGEGQIQAFGIADLGHGDGHEFGYISIKELIENGVELDFHFKPRSIAMLRWERYQAPWNGKVVVMGPDQLPLRPDPFSNVAEAEAFIEQWLNRYKQQGYYSAANGERIPLDVLPFRLKHQPYEDLETETATA